MRPNSQGCPQLLKIMYSCLQLCLLSRIGIICYQHLKIMCTHIMLSKSSTAYFNNNFSLFKNTFTPRISIFYVKQTFRIIFLNGTKAIIKRMSFNNDKESCPSKELAVPQSCRTFSCYFERRKNRFSCVLSEKCEREVTYPSKLSNRDCVSERK